MAYVKTVWVDRSDPIFDFNTSPQLDADNLNKIEDGIAIATVQSVLSYSSTANFPAAGVIDTIYIASDTNYSYYWSGVFYKPLDMAINHELKDLIDVDTFISPEINDVLVWSDLNGWHSAELPNVDGVYIRKDESPLLTQSTITPTIVNTDLELQGNGTGIVTVNDDLIIAGDLNVNGTTTTFNTEEMIVEDKNIVLGNTATPSDLTADGGGITLLGTTNKTIVWNNSSTAWEINDNLKVTGAIEATSTISGNNLSGTNSGDQNTFSVITGDTGTADANTFTDNAKFVGGTGITTNVTNNANNAVVAINITDNSITPLQLNVDDNGTANQVLVTDTLGGFKWEEKSSITQKNKLINGGFDIWQKGDSFLHSGYTADMWRTVTTTTSVDKHAEGAKVVFNNKDYGIEHPIEIESTGVTKVFAIGETFTISFDAYTVDSSPDFVLRSLVYGKDTAGSYTNAKLIGIMGSTITAVPTRHSYSFTVSEDINPTNTCVSLTILPQDTPITTDSIIINNIQLERGDVATPFEERHISLTLLACQRYYWEPSSFIQLYSGVSTADSLDRRATIQLPTTMRVAPTVVETPVVGGGTYTSTGTYEDSVSFKAQATSGAHTVTFTNIKLSSEF